MRVERKRKKKKKQEKRRFTTDSSFLRFAKSRPDASEDETLDYSKWFNDSARRGLTIS